MFFFQNQLIRKIFQEYYLSVKHIGFSLCPKCLHKLSAEGVIRLLPVYRYSVNCFRILVFRAYWVLMESRICFILNINYVYFDTVVSQIYPSELKHNKANTSDTKAALLDLHLSFSNDIVSTKNYDKRDDFEFEYVNFPFLYGDAPRSTSYGVFISQLICFARSSSHVADFKACIKLLTHKLLKQSYRYHKLRKNSK